MKDRSKMICTNYNIPIIHYILVSSEAILSIRDMKPQQFFMYAIIFFVIIIEIYIMCVLFLQRWIPVSRMIKKSKKDLI